MPNAFYTGACIDHVNGIAFADGLSGTFRHASAARDAIFANFHCHSKTLLDKIETLNVFCLSYDNMEGGVK